MALSTKPYTRLVQDWVAAAQGASSALLDFTTGAILRAIAEAQAGVALWLQGLILRVLAATRLATSSGSDADSFVADFGLTRLPALAATGLATFARFTSTNPATVPVGAQIQTADGSQTFAVYADTTNGAYSASLGGYVIAANVASVAVPVRAINAGTQGNIQSGALTVLQTGISGIDTVTNGAAFINGIDIESDAALRRRFVAYLGSLFKATSPAIAYAITSVQPNLQYTIAENVDYSGTVDLGNVSIVVDDGTGALSGALLIAVQNAVDAVRATGVRTTVYAGAPVTANIAMTLTLAAGYDGPTVRSVVAAALAAYVNGLGLGNPLPFTRLGQVAYDASPGVINVSAVALNGVATDLVPTYRQIIKPGTITVN